MNTKILHSGTKSSGWLRYWAHAAKATLTLNILDYLKDKIKQVVDIILNFRRVKSNGPIDYLHRKFYDQIN